MISQILILGSIVFIFMGLTGVKAQNIGKKLSSLCISTLGATALAFGQMNVYGLLGGCMQLLFRFSALIMLVLLLFHICKTNKIWNLDDLNGVGRKMPYIFTMITIFAIMIIGVPSTGTFMGILYSEMGLLNSEIGIFSKIGMIGNIAGVIVPALLIFPMWKRAYFPGRDAEKREEVLKPSKGIVTVSVIVTVLLVVFSLVQKPLVGIIGNVLGSILG